MAIKVPVGTAGVGERTGLTGRTIALVDLRPDPNAPHRQSNGSAVLFDLALREIEQAVRGEDRVCPFGTSRVAVAFGPDADSVSPKTLGERLARAVRHSAVLAGEAVGRVQPSTGPDGGAPPPRPGSLSSPATVTVDRVIGTVAPVDDAGAPVPETVGPGIPSTALGPGCGLRHRAVVRCSTGGFARYGTRRDDMVPADRGTILVVNPSRTSDGVPGLSALAASTMAQRLGYDVETVALSCDDDLVLDVHGSAIERVVIVVEGEREPTSERTTWASSTWHVPAQLTTAFRSRGIEVLAVGAGAGAGALAGCAAQGASVVVDFDELQAELGQTAEPPVGDESGSVPPGGGKVEPPMEALMTLTASERRVLFYLTTGRSAQDIADELVVSVTTVRSHIRSILRKLGVRSQLAAVAIANSQDFGHSQPGSTAQAMDRELEAPGVT